MSFSSVSLSGKEAPSLVYPCFKLFSVTGHHLNN